MIGEVLKYTYFSSGWHRAAHILGSIEGFETTPFLLMKIVTDKPTFMPAAPLSGS